MKVFVLLGNRMRDDGTISDLMRLRLELCVKYYNDHKPDYIIVSGGCHAACCWLGIGGSDSKL